MFNGGYLGKILRVNLSEKTAKTETIEEKIYLKLLGGRGLAAKYYYEEVGADVKPFDTENKIFFFAGPLTGLTLPAPTKYPQNPHLWVRRTHSRNQSTLRDDTWQAFPCGTSGKP